MNRSGVSLLELLVTSLLFSLISGAIVSALFAVPRWAHAIATRANLMREVRIARLALRRDLVSCTSVTYDGELLVLENAEGGNPVRYARRVGPVPGLERTGASGATTLVASNLCALAAVEDGPGKVWIELRFQSDAEWRRLVLMTNPRGGAR